LLPDPVDDEGALAIVYKYSILLKLFFDKCVSNSYLFLAALTGIFVTTLLVVYADGGDSSETSTDQEVKQKNIGSGDSTNFNCGQNLIKARVDEQEYEFED
jgi:hypothetical protein